MRKPEHTIGNKHCLQRVKPQPQRVAPLVFHRPNTELHASVIYYFGPSSRTSVHVEGCSNSTRHRCPGKSIVSNSHAFPGLRFHKL
jgi:hypothetical protein